LISLRASRKNKWIQMDSVCLSDLISTRF